MANRVLITPTTCDTIDRVIGFLNVARQYTTGEPCIGKRGKALRLQLVRVMHEGEVYYEIQVV